MRRWLLGLALATAAHAQGLTEAGRDATLVDRLVEEGRTDQAALLLPAAEGVPDALAFEVSLRAAWLDDDRAAVERLAASHPAAPAALLATHGLDHRSVDAPGWIDRVLALLPRDASRRTAEAALEVANRLDRLDRFVDRVNVQVERVRPAVLALAGTVPAGATGHRALDRALRHGQTAEAGRAFLAIGEADDPRRAPDALHFWTVPGGTARIAVSASDVESVGRLWAVAARDALRRGALSQAVECARRARAAGGLNPRALTALAAVTLATGARAEGERELEEPARTESDAALLFARELCRDGAFARAFAVLTSDRMRSVRVGEVEDLRLWSCAAAGPLPDARAEFGTAGERASSPVYWIAQAVWRRRTGDAAGAERAIAVAVAQCRGSTSKEGRITVAAALRQLGRGDLVRQLELAASRPAAVAEYQRLALSLSLREELAADALALARPDLALALVDRASWLYRAGMARSLFGEDFELEPELEAWLVSSDEERRTQLREQALRELEGPRHVLDTLVPRRDRWPVNASLWRIAALLAELSEPEPAAVLASAASEQIAQDPGQTAEHARLLLAVGSAEGLFRLARTVTAAPATHARPDAVIAAAGLGGLYTLALTAPVDAPAEGADLGRGLALAALDRRDEAEPLLARAAHLGSPWRAPALAALIELALARGDRAAAHRLAADLASDHDFDNPAITAAHDARGDTRRTTTDLPPARDLDHRGIVALAHLVAADGDLARARALLSRACDRAPFAALPRLELARLSPPPALDRFRDAVRAQPSHAPAALALAAALAGAHQDAGAAYRNAARRALVSGQHALAVQALSAACALSTTAAAAWPPAALYRRRLALPLTTPAAEEAASYLLEHDQLELALACARHALAHPLPVIARGDSASPDSDPDRPPPLPPPLRVALALAVLLAVPAALARLAGRAVRR